MPAPVVDMICKYLASGLTGINASVWDGEVPRYDVSGKPVSPESTQAPGAWPAVKVYMAESGFDVNYTFENPTDEVGDMVIKVWHDTRAACDQLAWGGTNLVTPNVHSVLIAESNWANMGPTLGGALSNPDYVLSCLLENWSTIQEERQRTGQSLLLHRCTMRWRVRIHSTVPSVIR